MLLVAMLLLPLHLDAAHLKPETVAAWDNYVQSVRTNLQDRVRPGRSFLWTSESPERLTKVHGGEIVVAPAYGENPRKIPEGLIHHWIGAAFLPNAKLDDVLTSPATTIDIKSSIGPPSSIRKRWLAAIQTTLFQCC